MSESDESEYVIGIDCPPGEPRPNAFFRKVLVGTGLNVSDFDLRSKLSGAWSWRLKTPSLKAEIFIAKRPLIRGRLERLFAKGAIRGGLIESPSVKLKIVK